MATAIDLAGLSGVNTVEVVGQNSVGEWQDEGAATVSDSWTVDGGAAQVLLSEIDAFNGRVEIWNNAATPLDANGYLVNGDVLTGQAVVPAGGYLVVDVTGLRTNGSLVGLADPAMQVIDEISYGVQIAGSTIARVGRDAAWGLAQPTLGSANIAQPTALRRGLKLSEWLLNSDCLFTFNFVELFNPEALPTSLAGISLDLEPALAGDPWTGAPLSFIAADGFMAILMDGDLAAGADHSDLVGLGDLGTEISLNDGGTLLEVMANNSDAADVSGGRLPAGGETLATFALPTPGFAVEVIEVETVTPLVAIGDVWSYEDSNTDLGTAWRAAGFDDLSWSSGGALLGRETSPDNLPEPLVTEINYASGIPTYYFRNRFDFDGDPSAASLRLRTVVDDGAVIYLNGDELHRLRMDDPVTHDGFASDNVGDADYEGPFELSSSSLVIGRERPRRRGAPGRWGQQRHRLWPAA